MTCSPLLWSFFLSVALIRLRPFPCFISLCPLFWIFSLHSSFFFTNSPTDSSPFSVFPCFLSGAFVDWVQLPDVDGASAERKPQRDGGRPLHATWLSAKMEGRYIYALNKIFKLLHYTVPWNPFFLPLRNKRWKVLVYIFIHGYYQTSNHWASIICPSIAGCLFSNTITLTCSVQEHKAGIFIWFRNFFLYLSPQVTCKFLLHCHCLSEQKWSRLMRKVCFMFSVQLLQQQVFWSIAEI